jgi:hypothetical protein
VGVSTERRRSIIVWGPPDSGKSLYLASLVLWLQSEREQPHLVVLPADAAAATWVTSRSRPFGSGIALEQAAAPAAAPCTFRVYETLPGATAGALRSRVVAELTQGDVALGDPAVARLEDAAGVILLLPAASMSARADVRLSHVSWLTATLARLPETLGAAPPTVLLPVAVCLTQTDAVPDAARRDAVEWLESFGTETTRALRAHCARYAVFKVSSLGHAPRDRDGMLVVPTAPEPQGVLAPIRWILGQTEIEAAA